LPRKSFVPDSPDDKRNSVAVSSVNDDVTYVTREDSAREVVRTASLFSTVRLTMMNEYVMKGFDTSTSMTYLRAVRVIRALRVLRILRVVEQLHELRLLMEAVLRSLYQCLWCILLVTMVVVMFGLCFVQGVVAYIEQELNGFCDVTHNEWCKDMQVYWGGLDEAFVSLFMAITGGDDWNRMASVLKPVGDVYSWMFLFYVIIMVFVMTNIVLSVFVNKVIDISSGDAQHIIRKSSRQQKELLDRIGELHDMLDESGGGVLSLDNFMKHAHDPAMCVFADHMQVDVTDLELLFRMLSSEGKRQVNLDDFARGCMRLRGNSKTLHLMELKLILKKQTRQQEHFRLDIQQRLDGFYRSLATLPTTVKYAGSRMSAANVEDSRRLSKIPKEFPGGFRKEFPRRGSAQSNPSAAWPGSAGSSAWPCTQSLLEFGGTYESLRV